MPGAYAHITLVNRLGLPGPLEKIPGFPAKAIGTILSNFKFCELGAVSPDYPYLDLGNKKSKKWADAMHYEHTGQMIQAGARLLASIKGEPQKKGLSWLLGYASHVVADVTVHPVIQLKVGPYVGNETAHRVCEMNQDTYIFRRLKLGEIGLSEHLKTGIRRCCGQGRWQSKLDPDIARLWSQMCADVHPDLYAKTPPDIHKWHRGFCRVVDDIAEEGDRLLPLARHVAADLGLTYPAVIDKQYVENLSVPNGGRQGYDQIFDEAIANVGPIWKDIAQSVLAGQDLLARLGEWNLDTGINNTTKKLVFWS